MYEFMLPEQGQLAQSSRSELPVTDGAYSERFRRAHFGNAEHRQRRTNLYLHTLKQHRRNLFKGLGVVFCRCCGSAFTAASTSGVWVVVVGDNSRRRECILPGHA